MRIFAKKVEADGYKFDSEMEYQYYLELKKRLEDKTIRDLEIHPLFELQPTFTKTGKTWKAIHYEADFKFFDMLTSSLRIVDVKGMVLPEFEIHRKMFEFKYPDYNLEVLKYSKTTGWVDIDSYKKTMRSKRQQVRMERTELKTRLERIAWLTTRINDLEQIINPSINQQEKKIRYEKELSELIRKKT
jgi:hypothetical protein